MRLPGSRLLEGSRWRAEISAVIDEGGHLIALMSLETIPGVPLGAIRLTSREISTLERELRATRRILEELGG